MGWKNIHKSTLFVIGLCFLSVPTNGNEDTSPDVRVELNSERPLWLHVTVRSRKEARVTFYKYQLPWGNLNSMLFVPVNRYGQLVVKRAYPIDDPSPEKVSLEPNEAISGDMDLNRFVPGLAEASKKSDIHLFWAYRVPKELNVPQWSGGWVLIPQQK
jgi:hypothetical protein